MDLTKEQSIAKYGDLTSLINGTLGVSYDWARKNSDVKNNFIFQIDGKDPITGIEAFKTQYNLQNEATKSLSSFDQVKEQIGVAKFKADQLIKTESIKKYGNLLNLSNIEVTNWNSEINFQTTLYQIASNVFQTTPIFNFDTLKKELKNQGIQDDLTNITMSNFKTLNDLSSLNGELDIKGRVEEWEWSQTDSINTYGDLTNLTDGTLGVSYEESNFVFQIDTKNKITGIYSFKNEYNLQNGIENELTTIEEIEAKIGTAKFKDGELAQEKAKAKTDSINTYGDLINLTDGTLGVSYDGTNFVFQIDEKNPITRIKAFKTQYDLQSGTTNSFSSFDQIKTKIGVAKFKEDQLKKIISIEKYGDLTNLNNVIIDYKSDNNHFRTKKNQTWFDLETLKIELIKQHPEKTIQFFEGLDLSNTKSFLKTKSIENFGDLKVLTNIVVKYFYADKDVFKTNLYQTWFDLDTLKIELKKQIRDKYSEIDVITLENMKTKLEEETTSGTRDLETSGTLNLTNYTATAKAYSINTYGDLTSQVINVFYDDEINEIEKIVDGEKFIVPVIYDEIKYTVNNQTPINFDQLKAEALKQEITLTNGKNTEATLDATDLTGLNVEELASAKSIKRYGNLNHTFDIIFDGNNFKNKTQTVSFDLNTLKTELKKQTNDSTKNSEIDAITLENMKTKLEEASIEKYGNLKDLTNIIIEYNSDGNHFKVWSNFYKLNGSPLFDLDTLKIELKKQIKDKYSEIDAITLENMKTKLEQETTSGTRDLGTSGTLDLTNYTVNAKTDSINTYGDLASQVINVSFDGTIKYTANNQTPIDFDQLKAEALKQEITSLTTEEALTDNSVLNGLVTSELTKSKSIATYGNLASQVINVSFDGTIKYTANNQTPIDFDQLKAEALKQEITLTNGKNTEATLDATDLTSLNVEELEAAKLKKEEKEASITRYGDLTNLTDGTLGVSYNGTNFVFQIDTKDPITGIESFKTQYDSQSGATNTLTTLKQIKTKIGATKFKAIELAETEKTKSIATYGDLTTQAISVSYVEEEKVIKYTINVQAPIDFDQLKEEATKQGITLTSEVTLNATQLTGLNVEELAEAKAKSKANSISTYGDLTNLTNETLGVSYNGTNFVFQIDTKDPITGIATFKTQYNLQNNETNDWTTIDQVETKITTENFKNSQLEAAKAKKTSIDQYGDLTNLDNVLVDYNGTNYTFQVGENSLITGLELFKTELENQEIATSTINDIDDIVETIDGLTGTLNTTNAKAKKTTAIISEPDLNPQFNNLLIIPIVLSIFVVIIAIGLLLKKYFKNKKLNN